jgi:hypothetical protein
VVRVRRNIAQTGLGLFDLDQTRLGGGTYEWLDHLDIFGV